MNTVGEPLLIVNLGSIRAVSVANIAIRVVVVFCKYVSTAVRELLRLHTKHVTLSDLLVGGH